MPPPIEDVKDQSGELFWEHLNWEKEKEAEVLKMKRLHKFEEERVLEQERNRMILL